MQCPNCGFENIPGRTACGVCSASLVKPPERESVMPDRARDRSLGQSIRWGIERRLHRSIPDPDAVATRIPPFYVVVGFILRCLAVVLSVVPGVGCLWSRSWKSAGLSALGALACAGLGTLLYKTRVLDVAALCFAALSVRSIIAGTEWAFPPTGDVSARMHRRVGRGLMAVSALTVLMMFGFLAPFSRLSLFYVPRDLPEIRLSAGDRILNVAVTSYHKGDIVVCQNGDLAVVDALPGGWADQTLTDGEVITGRLLPGEYGLRIVRWNPGGEQPGMFVQPVIQPGTAIRSRLTIIYNPPARRGLVRPAMYP